SEENHHRGDDRLSTASVRRATGRPGPPVDIAPGGHLCSPSDDGASPTVLCSTGVLVERPLGASAPAAVDLDVKSDHRITDPKTHTIVCTVPDLSALVGFISKSKAVSNSDFSVQGKTE